MKYVPLSVCPRKGSAAALSLTGGETRRVPHEPQKSAPGVPSSLQVGQIDIAADVHKRSLFAVPSGVRQVSNLGPRRARSSSPREGGDDRPRCDRVPLSGNARHGTLASGLAPIRSRGRGARHSRAPRLLRRWRRQVSGGGSPLLLPRRAGELREALLCSSRGPARRVSVSALREHGHGLVVEVELRHRGGGPEKRIRRLGGAREVLGHLPELGDGVLVAALSERELAEAEVRLGRAGIGGELLHVLLIEVTGDRLLALRFLLASQREEPRLAR